MNLPNALTVGRIVAAPIVGLLPFAPSWPLRLFAFVLFVVVAVTDYYDGKLARSRNLITDLGKQLDPLADKLLLVATLVPMYVLMELRGPRFGAGGLLERRPEAYFRLPAALREDLFAFVTPWTVEGLPVWVLAVILGREIFMTVFRSAAARRGVVIDAIGPAKWKTGFQLTWVGAAFFWFWMATAAAQHAWQGAFWRGAAYTIGIIGVVTMYTAAALTLYTLWLYLRRYGHLFLPGANAK